MNTGVTTTVKSIIAAFELARMRREMERRRQRVDELFTTTSVVSAAPSSAPSASSGSPTSSTSPSAPTSTTPTSIATATLSSTTTRELQHPLPARCSTVGLNRDERVLVAVTGALAPLTAPLVPSMSAAAATSPLPTTTATPTSTWAPVVLDTEEEVHDDSPVRYMAIDRGPRLFVLHFDQVGIPPKPPWPFVGLKEDGSKADFSTQIILVLRPPPLFDCNQWLAGSIGIRSIPWSFFWECATATYWLNPLTQVCGNFTTEAVSPLKHGHGYCIDAAHCLSIIQSSLSAIHCWKHPILLQKGSVQVDGFIKQLAVSLSQSYHVHRQQLMIPWSPFDGHTVIVQLGNLWSLVFYCSGSKCIINDDKFPLHLIATTRTELSVPVIWLWHKGSGFCCSTTCKVLVLGSLSATEHLLECITHGLCMLLKISWTPTIHFELLSGSILPRHTSLVPCCCSVHRVLCHISIQFQQKQAVSALEYLHGYFIDVVYYQLVIQDNPSAITYLQHQLEIYGTVLKVDESISLTQLRNLTLGLLQSFHCTMLCAFEHSKETIGTYQHLLQWVIFPLHLITRTRNLQLLYVQKQWPPSIQVEIINHGVVLQPPPRPSLGTYPSLSDNGMSQIHTLLSGYQWKKLCVTSMRVIVMSLEPCNMIVILNHAGNLPHHHYWLIQIKFMCPAVRYRTTNDNCPVAHMSATSVQVIHLDDGLLFLSYPPTDSAYGQPDWRGLLATFQYISIMYWFSLVDNEYGLFTFFNWESKIYSAVSITPDAIQCELVAALDQMGLNIVWLIYWFKHFTKGERNQWLQCPESENEWASKYKHMSSSGNLQDYGILFLILLATAFVQENCLTSLLYPFRHLETSSLTTINVVPERLFTPRCTSALQMGYLLLKQVNLECISETVGDTMLVQLKRGGLATVQHYNFTSAVSWLDWDDTDGNEIIPLLHLLCNVLAIHQRQCWNILQLYTIPMVHICNMTSNFGALLSVYLLHIADNNDAILPLKPVMQHTAVSSYGNNMVSYILISSIHSCLSVQFLVLHVCAPHTSMASTLHRVTGIYIFILHFYCLAIDDP